MFGVFIVSGCMFLEWKFFCRFGGDVEFVVRGEVVGFRYRAFFSFFFLGRGRLISGSWIFRFVFG